MTDTMAQMPLMPGQGTEYIDILSNEILQNILAAAAVQGPIGVESLCLANTKIRGLCQDEVWWKSMCTEAEQALKPCNRLWMYHYIRLRVRSFGEKMDDLLANLLKRSTRYDVPREYDMTDELTQRVETLVRHGAYARMQVPNAPRIDRQGNVVMVVPELLSGVTNQTHDRLARITSPFMQAAINRVLRTRETKILTDWPLLLALERNQTGVVRVLLNSGADPNANGGAPLWIATGKHSNGILVTMLLNAGANPNIDGADTPIIRAAEDSNPVAVKALLAHGAAPGVIRIERIATNLLKDFFPENRAINPVQEEHTLAVLDALVNYTRSERLHPQWLSSFDQANRIGWIDAVRLFVPELRPGLDRAVPGLRPGLDRGFEALMIGIRPLVDAVDQSRLRYTHLYTEIATLLLRAGADPAAAIMNAAQKCEPTIVEAIIKGGFGQIAVQWNGQGVQQIGPLERLAGSDLHLRYKHNGKFDERCARVIELLIHHFMITPETIDRALSAASGVANLHIVKLLLSKLDDIADVGGVLGRALDRCARAFVLADAEKLEIAKILLRHPIDQQSVLNALYEATWQNDPLLANFLESKGVQLTPFMHQRVQQKVADGTRAYRLEERHCVRPHLARARASGR